MSAVTHQGLRPVVGGLFDLVAAARNQEPDRDSFVILRPEPEGIRIERIGDGEFRVLGRSAERVVAISDVTSADALAYIDYRFEKIGVGRALSHAGAKSGDIVWVGSFSFDYEPDL
jgi:GTP-binding protein